MKKEIEILQEFFAHLVQFENELPTVYCYDLGSLIRSSHTERLTESNLLGL